jgi:hypothetical protein
MSDGDEAVDMKGRLALDPAPSHGAGGKGFFVLRARPLGPAQ